MQRSSQASKRKDRPQSEDEEGDHSEKRKKKGGKKRRKDKSERSRYEVDETEADGVEYQEELDEPHSDYGEQANPLTTGYDNVEDNAQDLLAAAGLEDSDADDDTVIFFFLGSVFSYLHTSLFQTLV